MSKGTKMTYLEMDRAALEAEKAKVEAQYEEIGVAEVDDKVYHALVLLDDDGEPVGDEYIILRETQDESGEFFLESIEDDEEFDRVADLFDKVIVLARDSGKVGRLAFYGSPDEAREFFGKSSMEQVVLAINSEYEGGEGRADEFIEKYARRTAEKEKEVTVHE